jgi:hypothetical protein
MDQPYSAFAAWLSKFHTAPGAIQALWLVAVPLTVLGVAVCLMRTVQEVAVAALKGRGQWRGHPVYVIPSSPRRTLAAPCAGRGRELTAEDLAEHGAAPPLPSHQ